ncbi:WGR domain-containing protein [Rhizobium leguminosarum]|uniref:WGR domain-containing protein n=1 Tax=Rhizobium leguminosarum TaxID=384 RepID=UPI00144202E4|nr:WGR domain-containing protein [Rhizobium leguminosarum]
MSVYPIKVHSISLDHRGGTKSYHLMMIRAANGNTVVVYRWGKTGVFGEVKIETYDGPIKAQKGWDKKEREKTNNGYSQTGPAVEKTANDASELMAAIGRNMFAKLGASNVKHLDPSFDTNGMREADDPQYDEETGKKLDTARRMDLAALLEEQKLKEAAEIAAAYEVNDLYGRF